MGRERRIWSDFLILHFFIGILYGCSEYRELHENRTNVNIVFKEAAYDTKSDMPDEDKISDITIMIFNERGDLEQHVYMDQYQSSYSVSLLKGTYYSIYACANIGYPIKASRESELEGIRFHLAYPDEYKNGIPMCAAVKDILIADGIDINLEFIRLMAQITLKMDRSRLSEDVNMYVNNVRIGNYPKYVNIFSPSAVTDEDGCFNVGFSYEDADCSPLNELDKNALSKELSLFMLENMQGKFSETDLISDQEKIFDKHDIRKQTCSFIEMELDYSSKSHISLDKPLIYRFYLGEDRNSLDIVRNCHYHITICPENDGLKEDSWRIDKSGVILNASPQLTQYPDDYIVGNIGDQIHIGCILQPQDTTFDIGLEYLEADQETGIYTYEIDEDGHGVTLTLTGSGRGLIYMEAGEPINDAALFLIEVNLP